MTEGPSLPVPGSQSSSNESSANPSRAQSVRGGKSGTRPAHKVKFSVAAGEEEEEEREETSGQEAGRRRDIPQIRIPSSEDVADNLLAPADWTGRTSAAAAHAQDRASRLANRLSNTFPGRTQGSRPSSIASASSPLVPPPSQQQAYASPNSSPPTKPLRDWLVNIDDIPLEPLDKDRRQYTLHDDTTDDDESDEENPKPLKRNNENLEEARRLIRTLTSAQQPTKWQDSPRSGTQTPAADKHVHDLEYVPPPDEYRPGVFGAILSSKLANLQRDGFDHQPRYLDEPGKHQHRDGGVGGHHPYSHSRTASETQASSGASSGRATPSKRPKWYEKSPASQSTGSMAALLAGASGAAGAVGAPNTSNYVPRPPRPPLRRPKSSSSMIATAVDMIKHPANHFHHQQKHERLLKAEEERVVHDVAEIIACRKYLKKLARALMAVGAPSHRLEEYMKTSARALSIDGDFLYLPGAMIVSINDKLTMSTEVTLVRESQNVDLGKFKDVYSVYKCVIHGKLTAEEGTHELEHIRTAPQRNKLHWVILAYGVAAVAVGPFAFSARPIDFPPSFVLGCILGFLQLVVVTRSTQFSHVFEVLATVIISFAARGLGSIYHNGSPVFCFSAIAQSSIALILPGYTVLCAALELQSKNLVSGSVRMVYAIIYSLFLGFGILIGTVIMGLIYPGAQSDVTCEMPWWWNSSSTSYQLIYARFIWVPIFAVCLAVINQAKWHQVPVMTLIAFCGHQATYWISTRSANNIQVANAIGAFVIGTMANLYSRFFHGLAAAAMLPAIFVQVPSGLAASGSLVAGVTSANQITGNSTSSGNSVSVINNGTAGFLDAQDGAGVTVYSGTIFNVGYGMVQLAIGISVGLYLSALVVYPIGKRRSGIFSF
ncbi:pheromone-regulated protein prm10 [Exophiala dermatitidis]|uniref:Threonine/serine exporter-like N-terminal domain-containing protein n=2 Tax=Exophiala dermatitidis TaxID=5970 RepID=H6BVY2_EXODN|nr:uncharacterized protein HMPREF1120_03288 [Exophiala dermatitidis NIH/UT8656]KAJ4508119.1 pheromone-regulated protein prm10 [Exophiala dermatitidis]EHY55136.1 hypothetical protein HMPREF1120_03288 [Exophiala dermatitidis NIH/UT8656]KAJ4513167.1 pheromone-regulated protein prm10 [Exophiala dermatitidis]KAJ4530313.1 pheromone-regulated protein prm10 [Exophiala dermatitidis]KAJ4540029.1 pheromone-regulated protein prm10 [Exophiala dermatitidis]